MVHLFSEYCFQVVSNRRNAAHVWFCHSALPEGTLKAFTWKSRVCSISRRHSWLNEMFDSCAPIPKKRQTINRWCVISTNLAMSIPLENLPYRWWLGTSRRAAGSRLIPPVRIPATRCQALFQKQRSAEQDQNRLLGSIQDTTLGIQGQY